MKQSERNEPPGAGAATSTTAAASAGLLCRVVSARQFLKMLVAAVGGAGLGQLATPARPAAATYTPGSPSDTVDTNLTVQGNLIVTPGNVGIGTTNPQGKLDIAGDIRVNAMPAVGSDGIARQCYYGFTTGSWAIVVRYTWGQCSGNNWSWQDLTMLQ